MSEESAESTPVDNGQAGTEAPAPESPAPAPEGAEPEETPSSEGGKQPAPEGEQGGKAPEENKEGEGEGTELAGELFFEGEQVDVTVPDELQEQLEASGVDVNKAVNELFGKDSDFTLSDETRAPLDEKYGKVVVDSYLNAIKAQNQNTLSSHKQSAKEAEEANQAAAEWSNELVGGEESWDALAEWAGNNLDESQIESFNRAMDSGDKWLQELAIRDLHNNMKKSEGDDNVELIAGDIASNAEGSSLTAQQYLSEMTSPSFTDLKGEDRAKAQAGLDKRRRAGLSKGI